jgi:Domain of unknown function (DUF1844)
MPSEDSDLDQPGADQLPQASFEVHLSMLFSQCLAALGQIPDPSGKPAKPNKVYARHFIDTVDMLGEKTKGNLTTEEAKMHSEILHAMRMAYVSIKTDAAIETTSEDSEPEA